MEKYNLDDKGGLFKFVEKKPSKVIKQGETIELKHFAIFNYIKGTTSELTDTTFRVQTAEKAASAGIAAGDPVALYYSSGDIYVVTGEVGAVNKADPLDITVKVVKIEKLKDLVKEKKHCVALNASFKIIGVPEGKPAHVKNISFGGIKVDCREDIMLEDIVDVTVYVDKMNKMPFKGRIVRKNKGNQFFEYGVEYTEMTESSNKLLTRIMYDIDSKL
jgi:hypothetical protein